MYTEKELIELEQFFISITLPQQVQLTPDQKIVEPIKFIESHLQVCRANPNNKAFQAFYDRLVALRNLFQKQSQK